MEALNQIKSTQRILMATIKSHRDKEGRRIADQFMKLAPRPDCYHKNVTTPIDIETICSKIEAGMYADSDELKRDFLQMTYNAQQLLGAHSLIARDSIVLQELFLGEKARIENEDQTRAAIEMVFGLDLLQEMILDYVIHDEDKKNAISNIRNCRLVNKNWLRSTSRVLLQCQEPLFQLNFDRNTSYNIAEFLNGISGHPGQFASIAPFKIIADTSDSSKFRNKRQSFQNCLVRCGNGLVVLCVTLGKDSPFLPDMDADIFLPNLKKFEVKVKHGSVRYNSMYTNFIQRVLTACKKLKSLKVFGPKIRFPEDIRFPQTITKLVLEKSLPDDNLEVLESALPPHLEKLILTVEQTPLKDGTLTTILEKARKTLMHFELVCWEFREDRKRTTFRLPLMEKLQIFRLHTPYLELEQNISTLDKLVPVLTHVMLSCHALTGLRKWTQSSCFPSVKSFKTSVVKLTQRANHPDLEYQEVNLDIFDMKIIQRAFPNLQHLHVVIYDGNVLVLWYIMKYMTNLTQLFIMALESKNMRVDAGPDFWEGILLGMSSASVAVLRNSPELWEHFRERRKVSIRNMKDLESFMIINRYGNGSTVYELSSTLFTYGFLQLPKLKTLFFQNLDVAQEMREAWREGNRKILVRLNELESLSASSSEEEDE